MKKLKYVKNKSKQVHFQATHRVCCIIMGGKTTTQGLKVWVWVFQSINQSNCLFAVKNKYYTMVKIQLRQRPGSTDEP